MSATPRLRMPGRIYEHFLAEALERIDRWDDVDLCDAISRARLKPRGLGFTAHVALRPAQARRLARWITDDHARPLRDYREQLLAGVDRHERRGRTDGS
jgi:hypothetical protein